jgi:hypothetical protein
MFHLNCYCSGDAFQARVPAMRAPIPPSITSTSTANSSTLYGSSVEGSAVWLSSRCAEPGKLDSYLRSIDALFYQSNELFDEEKALQLLHRCNYQIPSALELAQPWAKAEDDDDGVTGGGGKTAEFDSDDACHVCGDGGDLIICDAKGCKRVYHGVCADLSEIPSGSWECPIHFCATCGSEQMPHECMPLTISPLRLMHSSHCFTMCVYVQSTCERCQFRALCYMPYRFLCCTYSSLSDTFSI